MFERKRLFELLARMQGKRIAVWGDLVADRFVYGTPKRISREAPVLILRQYREDILLGGGGNAMNNILALGGRVAPVAIVGADAEGRALTDRLAAAGVETSAILTVDGYRTPTKTRVLGGMPHAVRQQIVRFDLEDFAEPQERWVGPLLDAARAAVRDGDGVLLSDYGYGAVTPELWSEVSADAKRRPVTLDSRYRMTSYRGVTAATPNEDEAAHACAVDLFGGDEETAIQSVGKALRETLRAEALLITRGSRGMALFEKGKPSFLPIQVWGGDQVADVTGAGDTVIATFTLALAAGATFAEAAKLANYAGGIVVMKMGTATASADELRDAIGRDAELE